MLTREFWLTFGLPFVILLPSVGTAAEHIISVGAFSKGRATGWETKIFRGETSYAFSYDPGRNVTVLEARSRAAASGRYRRIKVDLVQTPFLNWSWKVAHALTSVDENAKAGDDFSARLYVVVERGIVGLSSLSMNYVWASQHPVGSAWPSPITRNVRLLAVGSGTVHLNSWVNYKRNVRDDFREQFGEDILAVDAVALMTDTDNSGQSAHAFYGDIWFSSQ